MNHPLRSASSVAWLGLVLATLVSWRLGAGHGGDHRTAGTIIIVVALAKVLVVGWYFMGLRDAPRWLNGAFAGWTVVVGATLVSLHLTV